MYWSKSIISFEPKEENIYSGEREKMGDLPVNII